MYYLLNVDTPVPTDLMTWAKSFDGGNGLWLTRIELPSGAVVTISTVFLGVDHGFGSGPPVLFETMIFDWPGHEHEEHQWRYTSYAAAQHGHKESVALVVETS